MKKIFFTLLVLLGAIGTAFANSSFNIDDFQGGTITLSTTVSSQADARGGTVANNGDAGQTFSRTADVSIPAQPVEIPAPEIIFEEYEDYVIVHAIPPEGCQLFCQILINGEEVENVSMWEDLEVVVESSYEGQTIEVIAFAIDLDGGFSETVSAIYEMPPKERPVTDAPEVEFIDNGDVIEIIVTGNGELSGRIMFDSEEIAIIDGENQFIYDFYRPMYDYDDHVMVVEAYATAPDCLQSEATVETFVLPAIVPPDTPAPEISFEVTEEAVVITIYAEGTLWVCIDGEEYYEYDYGYYDMRVITIPRGEEDRIITIGAYAQIDGWMPSSWVEYTIEIPALEQIYDFEEDGIFYKITSEGKVCVTYETTDYNCYSGNVVIPANVTHDGVTYMVTAINDRAFMYCTELAGVTIGGNVTTIGSDAFRGCTGLTNVVLGNYVISIGSSAFYGCTSLSSVTLGSGVRNIGAQAFKGCAALTSVICKPAVPPVMANSNCFDCYTTATLTVHPAVADSYRATANWKMFAAIDERAAVDPAPGDVDGDGEVNISDVTTLIDKLLGLN